MDKVEVSNIFSQSDAISSSNEPQYSQLQTPSKSPDINRASVVCVGTTYSICGGSTTLLTRVKGSAGNVWYQIPQDTFRNLVTSMPCQRFRFSPEELRILKECNRESFYYRSLPLAAASVMAVHIAVRKGFLKSHPRWGSAMKFIDCLRWKNFLATLWIVICIFNGAGFIGWFLGKVSYQSVCEEKFMHLPNSSIGEALRKKKGYDSEMITEENPVGRADEIMLTGDQLYSHSSDLNYSSSSRSVNLDTDKNVHYVGLDDCQRPTVDNSSRLPTEDNKPTRSHTTYEDLRKKNREEYEIRQIRPYQSIPSPPSVTWDSYNAAPSSIQSSPRVENAGSQKNVYGDAWDD